MVRSADVIVSRSASLPLAGAQALQRLREHQAVALAGSALATRLDREEPGRAGGDRGHVGALADHDEAGGAEAAAGLGHVLVRQRGVEQLRGQGPGRHPTEDRPDDPAPQQAASDLVDGGTHGGPQGDLSHRRAGDVARHRTDDGAGRMRRAVHAEPVGPLLDDGGDVRQGLDVADQGRRRAGLVPRAGHLDVRCQAAAAVDVVVVLDELHDAASVRRGDAGERRPAVHDLEQRRLLAEEVLVGPGRHGHVDIPQHAGVAHLGDGRLDPGPLDRARGLERHHDVAPGHGVGGDERALDHRVGVGAQDGPVLERTGLALGAVHHDAGREVGRQVARHRAPLGARGESPASPAAEPRRLHLGHHRVGLDAARRLDALPATRIQIGAERIEGTPGKHTFDEGHGPFLPACPDGDPPRLVAARAGP